MRLSWPIVMLAFSAAGAQVAAQTASAPIAGVRYELTFDSASAGRRTVGVSMSFDVAGTAPVLLSLPAWAPGHYELINFARNVRGLEASQGGRPLGARRADPDTWRIRPTAPGRVTVRFDYAADTLQTASAWSQADFLMLNGTNVFPFAQGRPLDFPATVTVRTAPGWHVVTGMHAGGSPFTYRASSYHDLTDMPFFIGRFDVDSALVAGRWTRLASYPAGRLAGEARASLWTAMKRFIPAETAIFGETPWDDYTVFMLLPDGFNGASALEHQSSNVGIYAPAIAGTPGAANVVAHEMFHAFNVKRLRPADMFPYRYDVQQPTPLLWISEGFSDYYSDLAEVRGGAIDSAGFARNTLGHMQVVAGAPPASVEDASLAVWIHPRDGTDYIYYDKGSVIGLLLDILIRDASGNRGSLDDLVRSLYRSAWKQGRGFTGDEFWAAASRAAGGVSFADFRRRYVEGAEPLPYDSVLPLAGMRRVVERYRAPRLGINSFGDSTGLRITGVTPGSAFALAGGQVGDTLLVVGGIDVRQDPEFDQFRHRWAGREGESFPVVLRRGGQTLTLTAPVQLYDRTDLHLEYIADPGARAARVRAGILHGTTGP